MKSFNTIGFCCPEQHYMADVENKVRKLARAADAGKYCNFQGSRKSGKTSLLFRLREKLLERYCVLYVSFRMPKAAFGSSQAFVRALVQGLEQRMEAGGISPELKKEWDGVPMEGEDWERAPFDCLRQKLRALCTKADRGVVLLLDGPDESHNLIILNKFLSVLQDEYENARELGTPALHSVILASVRDVRSLKTENRYGELTGKITSWTIASRVPVNLNFTGKEIASMLAEYEAEHRMGMDVQAMAALLREYTEGQPYLVSRMCQALEEKTEEAEETEDSPEQVWSREGFLEMVRQLLDEHNPFFDGLLLLVEERNGLSWRIRGCLMDGKAAELNAYQEDIRVGIEEGLLKEQKGLISGASRFLEMYFTRRFASQMSIDSLLSARAKEIRKEMIRTGRLDVEETLCRYRIRQMLSRGTAFGDSNRLHVFQAYLTMILSGCGTFYAVPETRDENLMDFWIDALGQRYMVRLRDDSADMGKEERDAFLQEYLDRYGLQVAYLLDFHRDLGMVRSVRHTVDGGIVVEA